MKETEFEGEWYFETPREKLRKYYFSPKKRLTKKKFDSTYSGVPFLERFKKKQKQQGRKNE